MPVWILDAVPRPIGKHDVCATFGDVANVLTHALLCDEDENPAKVFTRETASVKCVHMGPPLRAQTTSIDVFGSAELTSEEHLQVKAFIDDRLLERKAQKKRLQLLGERLGIEEEYVICPASVPPTPSRPLWRFNCAGFVLQAYSEANIKLLADQLPRVGIESIIQAYPSAQEFLNDPVMRDKMGISDGDKWPVIFVGYVICSLSRTADEIRARPYVATENDLKYAGNNSGNIYSSIRSTTD